MSKSVLITGASSRIGKHIAYGLAEDGWQVIIHYNRSKQAALNTVEDITKRGGNAVAIDGNLSVPQDVDSLIERTLGAVGGYLSALINNASTFDDDRISQFTRATFDHHINVNLYAPIRLAQHFAKQLPADQKGSIINLLDQRVLHPDPSYFTYAISKNALFAATKTMAQDLAPKIRVNGIGPGPTLRNKAQTEAMFNEEVQSTLLGEGSPPHTIVQAVRYLLAADAVTGQMIAVDGGQHLASILEE